MRRVMAMGPWLSIFTLHSFLINILHSPHFVRTSISTTNNNSQPSVSLNNHHTESYYAYNHQVMTLINQAEAKIANANEITTTTTKFANLSETNITSDSFSTLNNSTTTTINNFIVKEPSQHHNGPTYIHLLKTIKSASRNHNYQEETKKSDENEENDESDEEEDEIIKIPSNSVVEILPPTTAPPPPEPATIYNLWGLFRGRRAKENMLNDPIILESSKIDPRLKYTTVEFPSITAIRIEANDKGVTYEHGVSVILANVPTSIRFFGRHITNHTIVKFTSDHGNRGSDCNDADSTIEYSLAFSNYESGTLEMSFPEADHEKEYFVCVAESSTKSNAINWRHQGMDHWVTIKVFERMLPIWAQIIFISILLFISELFAGLTLGLLALDTTDLKVLENAGSMKEQIYAKSILPLRTRGNYLLCSLVLGNVLVNSTLTILLDNITSGLIALITSTAGIVIFGEIIPQAICSRNGLAVGAKTIYITKFFMFITAPLAWPLSKILDRALGEEIGSVYTRERLKELLKVTKDHHGLEIEEVALISGALNMRTKTVRDIMTRIDAVFMLPLDATLDYETVAEIEFQGYTRIPVYESSKSNVVAVLNVKQLTLLDASDNIPIRTVVEYYQTSLFYVFENTRLDYMFRAFREGSRGHMAFVQKVNDEGPGDPYYETIGVVTMEDVLEELLQADIMDETDVGKYKSRLEHKERPRNFPFLTQKKNKPIITIPPPLALAACQFLTTAVPAFNRNLISETILDRLVKSTVTLVKPPKIRGHETPKYIYLYENGKPTDSFMMILEGRVQVEVGKEKVQFQAGPFQFFGAEFLMNVQSIENSQMENQPSQISLRDREGSIDNGSGAGSLTIGSSVDNSFRKFSFTPDYTVRVMQECVFINLKYSTYHAAKVATELERKYASDPKAALQNKDWENEVEKMLTIDDEESYVVVGRRMVCDSIEANNVANANATANANNGGDKDNP